ncbi:hypothetical protein [Polaromonas vacuolata]|nr:hypothetical protein [Polaromonas vacuolata]
MNTNADFWALVFVTIKCEAQFLSAEQAMILFGLITQNQTRSVALG